MHKDLRSFPIGSLPSADLKARHFLSRLPGLKGRSSTAMLGPVIETRDTPTKLPCAGQAARGSAMAWNGELVQSQATKKANTKLELVTSAM